MTCDDEGEKIITQENDMNLKYVYLEEYITVLYHQNILREIYRKFMTYDDEGEKIILTRIECIHVDMIVVI